MIGSRERSQEMWSDECSEEGTDGFREKRGNETRGKERGLKCSCLS